MPRYVSTMRLVLARSGRVLLVLGGSEPGPASDESIEERRRRTLEATLSRLKEEETEDGCGTVPARPSQSQ